MHKRRRLLSATGQSLSGKSRNFGARRSRPDAPASLTISAKVKRGLLVPTALANFSDNNIYVIICFDPGYRIYLVRDGERLLILVGGGDKESQATGILAAKRR